LAADPLSASARAVKRVAESALPTRFGEFRILVYRVDGHATDAAAVVAGTLDRAKAPLVRLHSECLTGEALGSLRCDCGEQLEAALALVAASGGGILLYLRQEGRGIGLANKIRAYALQDRGFDTVDANRALALPVDAREYSSAAAILADLGITRVRLLTNNPAKAVGLARYGIHVVERVPLEVVPNPVNRRYLRTKATRMGHLIGRRAGRQEAV
jgi:3,4-dihydroxy 2-butanone 4-phosphate synthase/GTP cyclohydrolase II